MNATQNATNVQFMGESPDADRMDWMSDIQDEQRHIFAAMVSEVVDPALQDIQDEHDAIVAHAFAQVDTEIAREAQAEVEKMEILLAHIVGAEPIQGCVFVARGEAYSTFNAAVLAAATPKTGCTRGEPFIEWLSIDDFDFGNNGQLYIGETYKQAAHAFAVWLNNKMIREAA